VADTIPTVRIVSTDLASQGAFVEINEDDFDASVHTLYGADSELTVRELCADLEAMGVDFDPRAKKAVLQKLRDEARAIRDA